MAFSRRVFVSSGALAIVAAPAAAQHEGHGPMYERLNQPGRIDVPAQAVEQRVFDSLAPKAKQPGRWIARAPLPLPRSEMAWATTLNERMHVVGGYGEQRVDRHYHHVYDAAANKWIDAAPLPKGANHVGVVVQDGKLYAFGGFVEQNRTPHDQAFAYDEKANAWTALRPMPEAFGSIGCVALNGKLHLIGGAIGDSNETKASVAWHYVYDPATNAYEKRAPLPTARDHTGTVEHNGVIHVVGGRVNNFYTNSNLHHSYDAKADKWTMRNPLPTARSGHGAVLYRGKMFVMGGEGANRVFGQNEAYDFAADKWEQYAPMPTPRHGLGAALIGDAVYVAGGGAQMGGGVQSAIHEAFTLG